MASTIILSPAIELRPILADVTMAVVPPPAAGDNNINRGWLSSRGSGSHALPMPATSGRAGVGGRVRILSVAPSIDRSQTNTTSPNLLRGRSGLIPLQGARERRDKAR
ncbi:hypothetical protein J7T55_007455 [Diaporthe amygdali]|uniref:uncharacterized protein n=1 Tax=Phomopsis amygdali TaxID=1214568 RepID=UPI0022FDB0CE|nr:uncharacterized protein J7T55_007455 [Diaporthe amygdali]KAJ0116475.1 hypothetical protein J7T55_007455 [Diaporthe amygdali]